MLYTRMCVYAYAYVRICIRVYAYWADAHYAYILVRIYLSCTVVVLQPVRMCCYYYDFAQDGMFVPLFVNHFILKKFNHHCLSVEIQSITCIDEYGKIFFGINLYI